MRLTRAIRDVRTVKRLLTGAENEAHHAGESVPGAEHLLLSALELPDGTARRAFERLGVDPTGLAAAIAAQHAAALRAAGLDLPDPSTDPDPGTGIGTVDLAGLAAGASVRDAAVASNPPRATGVYRADASADAAFRAAVDLAKSPKPVPLVGAHVVIAVARLEHGTAPRALREMNIDRHELAAAARGELATATP